MSFYGIKYTLRLNGSSWTCSERTICISIKIGMKAIKPTTTYFYCFLHVRIGAMYLVTLSDYQAMELSVEFFFVSILSALEFSRGSDWSNFDNLPVSHACGPMQCIANPDETSNLRGKFLEEHQSWGTQIRMLTFASLRLLCMLSHSSHFETSLHAKAFHRTTCPHPRNNWRENQRWLQPSTRYCQ